MKKRAEVQPAVNSKQHDRLIILLLTIVILIGLVNLIYYFATYSALTADSAQAQSTKTKLSAQPSAQGAVSLEIINPPPEATESSGNNPGESS